MPDRTGAGASAPPGTGSGAQAEPPALVAAPGVMTPDDVKLFERIAETAVRYRMTVPAILFLESVKPLSFIGSQAMYFFEPMVRALFTVPEYERFAALVERRENLEALLVAIERRDEAERRAEKDRRDQKRAERAARKQRKDGT
ncbi:MAG: hypothetical protein ACM3JJ_03600 [Hyphomicrobiales bacterium]